MKTQNDIKMKPKENKEKHKKEFDKQSQKKKKPKKDKKPNISIPSPQMPTHSLLLLEQIKKGESEISLDHTIKLEDLPLLMNSIAVPIEKMTPDRRLEYMKTMKLEKTPIQTKEKTKQMKKIKQHINIVEIYKTDQIKFKILTGLNYESFIHLVDLLECQIVRFTGNINVRNCKFEKASHKDIQKMSNKYKLDVESTIFLFIVFVRTGLDFTKLFAFLNLEQVTPYRIREGDTNEKYIERNKAKMSAFVHRYISTFLRRYTMKIQRDFIDQVSSCASTNIPIAVGMTVNDALICPELLYSYRVIDSKTVQCTTQWINKKDKKGNEIKKRNTDLYSEKVNASGFKYEIQINKCCFITHVVSSFGKTSDINLSKIGDAGTFNYGISIADSGYSQKDYHGVITPLKKNCVHNEEDKKYRSIFNSTITQSRNIVEQVFGNMATLFGILKTNYIEDKSLFQMIITCICGLYNYYLIQGPIRNDLINNRNNEHLLNSIDVDDILQNKFDGHGNNYNVINKLHIPQSQYDQSEKQIKNETPYSIFGYNNGINQPFQQMEKILMKSQIQNPLNCTQIKSPNEIKSNNPIDVDTFNPSKNKNTEIFVTKYGISISNEEMSHLKNGDFISPLIVDYILRKTVNNKDIYVFETLEPYFISQNNDESLFEMFKEASLYPIWICPVCDNGHFTLFIIHVVHINSLFQGSCILYFNSLPSFSSNVKDHLDMIKRISICVKSKFDDKLFTINVPYQSSNDCGCCVCYFAQRYSNYMPQSIDQTNQLFNGQNVKVEMDNERNRMIRSIEEDRYFGHL